MLQLIGEVLSTLNSSCNVFFSSECLDGWCCRLAQCGDTGVCCSSDKHCGYPARFHLGAPNNQDASNITSWGFRPFSSCKGRRRWAWSTHQVRIPKNFRRLIFIFVSRYKLDTRYSGAGEFFRLDPLSGRLTVRRALKELDSNQAAAPILLRIIAQEVRNPTLRKRKCLRER